MKFFTSIVLLLGFASLTHATDLNTQSAAAFGINAQNAGIECSGSYYNWGKSQSGYGYCYQWACTGDVLNNGQPVSNYSCEAVRPSYYDWSKSQSGYGYCYQYTPQGVVMNQGQPQSNYNCERTRPSYYSWGRSQDGQTRCYQYTAKGVVMNAGQPVSNYNCQ